MALQFMCVEHSRVEYAAQIWQWNQNMLKSYQLWPGRRHYMGMFSPLIAIVRRINRWPDHSPHKKGSNVELLIVTLLLTWTSCKIDHTVEPRVVVWFWIVKYRVWFYFITPAHIPPEHFPPCKLSTDIMILILRCVCATLIRWDILDPLVYFTYNKKRIKP